ncbi:hypothetical protein C8Q78DRAFT_77573 [Trametes maxima]|nr:hypothetical protein C8Q78DRAFT_77573 [Trametes maxima]
MPPRIQPKTFILLLKTHKLTVLLTLPSTSTVADVKVEALTALQSSVLDNPEPNPQLMDDDDMEWKVPKVSSLEDFELARTARSSGRPAGQYEKLELNAQLKTVVANWDPIFVQFKDPNGEWAVSTRGLLYIPSRSIHFRTRLCAPLPPCVVRKTGGLLPVKVSIPPINPEEHEDPATQKGKRKADE